jgi:hypothetical protein
MVTSKNRGKYEGVNPLERLRENEPYFLVRGQDLLSPATVVHYSELLQGEADKAYLKGDIRLWESLSDQAAQVAGFSRQFIEWQQEHPEFVKLPD